MSGHAVERASLRDYLFSLALHGVKLGLHNILHLLDAAGNPQKAYPAIHIAGTNGKGSVTAMLGAMFEAAGYRTGRFTSPHLIDVRERFLVDGDPIPEADLEESIAFFRAVAETMDPPPTFFEVNTAIAFRWFAQQNVDAAVIEVGMGGQLDSTNVLDPVATAITNIGLEHTQYLGETLEAIAGEKAGILKPDRPVVVGETAPGPLDVILDRAAGMSSPAIVLNRDFSYELAGDPWRQSFSYSGPRWRLNDVPLALAGGYQGANAAVATALAESLSGAFPRLDVGIAAAGLRQASWPCRLEQVLEEPPVIIDVAHNAAGAQRLAASLGRCVAVLAVSSDKDAAGIVAALAPHAERLILAEFAGKRTLTREALSAAAAAYPHETAASLPEAIVRGISLAREDCPLLVTGSIYTAGEARQFLIDEFGAAPLRF